MGELFMNYHPNRLIREYNDRRMAKWIGFYLSEHTAAMNKESSRKKLIYQIKPEMTPAEVTHTIEEAILHNSRVSVQLSEVDQEGNAYEDISGSVAGYDTQTLYILQLSGEVNQVPTDLINHVEIIDYTKWSALS